MAGRRAPAGPNLDRKTGARESVVIRRELTYTGSKPPEAEYLAASPFVRFLTIVLVLAGLPLIFVLFWLGERTRGRFVRPREAIDGGWLEKHILSELPEIIGYMYDNRSGPAEVAAILARLTQEGRITSSVEPRRLRAPLLRMALQATGRDLLVQEGQLVQMFSSTDRTKPTRTAFGNTTGREASILAHESRNRWSRKPHETVAGPSARAGAHAVHSAGPLPLGGLRRCAGPQAIPRDRARGGGARAPCDRHGERAARRPVDLAVSSFLTSWVARTEPGTESAMREPAA